MEAKKEKTLLDIDKLNSDASAAFERLDLKTATKLALKAYTLSRKHKYDTGMAESLMMRGIIFSVQQENRQARELHLQAMKILESKNPPDLSNLNKVYGRLGITYGQMGLDEESTKFFTKALDVSKQINSEQLLAEDYQNLAISFLRQAEYAKANQFFTNALNYAEKTSNEKLQASILTNIAKLHSEQNEHNIALTHAQKALTLSERHNNLRNTIQLYFSIATILTRLERYDESKTYFDKCIAIASKQNITPYIIASTLGIANIYIEKKQYDKAKTLLCEVDQTPALHNYTQALQSYYSLYLRIYEETSDFKKAYEKQKELIDFERKLAEENLKARLESAEVKWEDKHNLINN